MRKKKTIPVEEAPNEKKKLIKRAKGLLFFFLVETQEKSKNR